ncbi:MAG TPA: ATP-binding protein [Puia sp.]|jgi:two-component system NtrC family sensor kinase|nr:ATP-binding protein [Puia sp.]
MKSIRSVSLIILLILLNIRAKSQDPTIAKLRMELNNTNSDSSRFGILDSLSIYYVFCSDKIDSAYFYANENIKLSSPLADKRQLILSYARMGSYYYFSGQYGAALQVLHKGITLAEQISFYDYSSFCYLTIAELYSFLNQFHKARANLEKAVFYFRFSKDPFYNIKARTFVACSVNYLLSGELDSASIYFRHAKESFNGHMDFVTGDLYLEWAAMLKSNLKEYQQAKELALKGLEAIKRNDDHQMADLMYYQYAIILEKTNQPGEAIIQAKHAFDAAKAINDSYFMVPISKLIFEYYDKLGMKDSTLHYLKINADYSARVDSAHNIGEAEATEFSEQLHAQETDAQSKLAEEKDKNRSRQFVFTIGLVILVSVSLIMWRNSVNRKKAFFILSQQKAQIELQKSKTEQTLKELKATQAQLIQSEKMASLGELTAGIAHEIQNPLNFVNNFSEVNKELIDEASQANEAGNSKEVKELLSVLKENEEKIIHHGKRADAIVKGMLQHSRSSTGAKEPTDINALADEYLRLAYHGLRAKDNSFNAAMRTDFDHTIGNINIIPQDIGIVLLNLYSNALYAVAEKKKQQAENYEPAISLSTKRINDQVEIRVKDNGNGIPPKVVDKIFQPFFTTKPTGQGTGLGLSLSYDIVKAHSGEIKVNSREGEFTECMIQLPISG